MSYESVEQRAERKWGVALPTCHCGAGDAFGNWRQQPHFAVSCFSCQAEYSVHEHKNMLDIASKPVQIYLRTADEVAVSVPHGDEKATSGRARRIKYE